MASRIPIQNIYYLLCYAWNKLEERDAVDVSAIESTELVDLFAKVLVNGTTKLFKQGLDRYYVESEDIVNGIRGKFNLTSSIKMNYLPIGKTVCQFDDFEHDILHNQILKATIHRLLMVKVLDPDLRRDLHNLYSKLPLVSERDIQLSDFGRVRLHRNNWHYDLVLKVCRIVYENLLPEESLGSFKFSDFLQDDGAMARLFESFLRNFYKLEQSEYQVQQEYIKWKLTSDSEEALRFVPGMNTDISLISPNKKIIIDAKYYRDAFQNSPYGDHEKIISGHLYQLFSYLLNQETGSPNTESCEGILLYPTTETDFKYKYKFGKHDISVESINLNQDWRKIKTDLLKIIG